MYGGKSEEEVVCGVWCSYRFFLFFFFNLFPDRRAPKKKNGKEAEEVVMDWKPEDLLANLLCTSSSS